MALTKEQEDLLAALEAQRDERPPRTTTGIAGVLHELIDLVTGATPHVSPERAEELHSQAEDAAGDGKQAEDSQGAPLVSVADQKAAGVAPGDTVTIADQKAGTPAPELAEEQPGAAE